MATATWTTTPIPAAAVAVGDRLAPTGTMGFFAADKLVVADVEYWPGGVVRLTFGTRTTLDCDAGDLVEVRVPDVPVDGYGLWKPHPGEFPSGCVCVSRRHPDRPGNWTIVAHDDTCRSHGIHDDYED